MPTLEDLGQKVKAKYPGQYDDLSDADVGTKVKAKFPGSYDDFAPAAPTKTEKPGIMERAISNLPSSAANAITHPTFPGMPTDTEIPAGQNFSDVFEKNKQETIQGFKDLWKHPIDTVVNYVKEKFATDPVGTSLAVAALGKPALEGTPVAASLSKASDAVASIPGKVAEVAKTPGTMTIAKGAAQGAAGAGAMIEGHPFVGGGLLVRGWQNVVKGMEERRAAQNAPPPILDDLAQSLAGKEFAKLTPDAQAQIRQISEQVREPVRKTAPPPVTENGRISTGEPSAPGKTMAQYIQGDIDARKAKAAASQEPAAERTPIWKDLPKPSEEKFGPPEGPMQRPQLPSGRKVPGQPESNPVIQEPIKQSSEFVTLHRGNSSSPGTANYYSTSRDFAREFTQSGQDSEISSVRVPTNRIMDLGEKTPEATDTKAIAKAKAQAKANGAAGFYVDEGANQPKSVFLVDKSSAEPVQQFEGAYQIPPEERTGQVKPAPKESYQRAARTVKGRALARWLRIGGISAEDAQSMTAEQWGMAAEGAGVNAPSPDSVKVALSELDKLYNAKGAVKIDEALKKGNQAEAHFYMEKAASE